MSPKKTSKLPCVNCNSITDHQSSSNKTAAFWITAVGIAIGNIISQAFEFGLLGILPIAAIAFGAFRFCEQWKCSVCETLFKRAARTRITRRKNAKVVFVFTSVLDKLKTKHGLLSLGGITTLVLLSVVVAVLPRNHRPSMNPKPTDSEMSLPELKGKFFRKYDLEQKTKEYRKLVHLIPSRNFLPEVRREELETASEGLLAKYPNSAFTWYWVGVALKSVGESLIRSEPTSEDIRHGHWTFRSFHDTGVSWNDFKNFDEFRKLTPDGKQKVLQTFFFEFKAEREAVRKTTAAGIFKMNDAIDAFSRAISLDPENSPSHLELALVYERLLLCNKALAEVHRAVELDPNYYPALSNLGRMLMDFEKDDEAMEFLLKAVKLEPGEKSAWSNLANLYDKKGQSSKADEVRRQMP